ncbi:MAG: hypothetical protein QNJ45_10625 [Ardenticatenaceae bacterium]|nr:hypothetical protein [Ardenticatenaceae bacterium]
MNHSHFQAGLRYLAARGLNLVAILDVGDPPVQKALNQAQIEHAPYRRLLLVAHGGRMLWRAFQAAGGEGQTVDPIDRYSRRAVSTVMREFWGVAADQAAFLYPLTDHLVPLQQLGTAAGWSHRSPIGTDIHPDYGLWFAYRAAVLVKNPLPLLIAPMRPSPCDSCDDRPCVTACPAGAVGEIGRFGLNACVTHRLYHRSSCAGQCLARLACPVAVQHRYTAEQIAYHYGQSLKDIRRYYMEE